MATSYLIAERERERERERYIYTYIYIRRFLGFSKDRSSKYSKAITVKLVVKN